MHGVGWRWGVRWVESFFEDCLERPLVGGCVRGGCEDIRADPCMKTAS